MKAFFILVVLGMTAVVMGGCAVGPNYQRPAVSVPPSYKESNLGSWKESEPQDQVAKGNWWELFGDATLDDLEEQAAASNQGLKAAYLPNPSVEMGHDPHSILMCRNNTRVLWQQNHCGIFRSTDGGANWDDVSGANRFPLYGFALAIDEEREDTAFVIPAQSDQKRIPVDLKLTVCKTTDGGKSWHSKSRGLPDSNVFDLVLRHSFIRREKLLCFGTTNGNIYASQDDGESWTLISGNLATVNCLILI